MTYRRWASLHRFVGLALLLHWALLAGSGMLLVFHRDIEQALLAGHAGRNAQVSLDTVKQRIAVARPGSDILQISTLNGGMDLLRIRVQPEDGGEVRSLVFDAGTQAIVGDSPLSGSMDSDGLFQFVYRLHQTLLLGDTGKTLVAFSGLFLIFSAIAGYRLLWPQRKNWRRIIRPKLVGRSRVKMTLAHRAIGVLAGPILIVLGVTGAGMNWTAPIKTALAQVGLSDSLSSPQKGLQPPSLSPDAALALAQRRFPDASFTSIALPAGGANHYNIRLRQPGEAHAIFGMTNIRIDGATGTIVSISDPRRSKLGDKMLEWLFALHNGEFLGLPGRLLVLLTGAALLALCLLGAGAWLRTPRREPRGKSE